MKKVIELTCGTSAKPRLISGHHHDLRSHSEPIRQALWAAEHPAIIHTCLKDVRRMFDRYVLEELAERSKAAPGPISRTLLTLQMIPYGTTAYTKKIHGSSYIQYGCKAGHLEYLLSLLLYIAKHRLSYLRYHKTVIPLIQKTELYQIQFTRHGLSNTPENRVTMGVPVFFIFPLLEQVFLMVEIFDKNKVCTGKDVAKLYDTSLTLNSLDFIKDLKTLMAANSSATTQTARAATRPVQTVGSAARPVTKSVQVASILQPGRSQPVQAAKQTATNEPSRAPKSPAVVVQRNNGPAAKVPATNVKSNVAKTVSTSQQTSAAKTPTTQTSPPKVGTAPIQSRPPKASAIPASPVRPVQTTSTASPPEPSTSPQTPLVQTLAGKPQQQSEEIQAIRPSAKRNHGKSSKVKTQKGMTGQLRKFISGLSMPEKLLIGATLVIVVAIYCK